MTLTLMVLGLLALIALRVPIAFALLIPGMLYLLVAGLPFSVAAQQVTLGVDSFPLLAVPLFIMVGYAANESGITDRLYSFAEALVGHVRGSLGYVNVLVSLFFSWMSGSAVADAAGLGRMAVPAMVSREYPARFSVGITGASTAIGPIMPPSIPAIIYGVTSGVSIGALFLAGIVPALLIVAALSVTVYLYMRKEKTLRLPRAPLREIGKKGLAALLAAVTPVIILGGILGGVFTPTEAAAAAVVYVLILSVAVYRSIGLRSLGQLLRNTGETTAGVMIIVASASLFGWILAREQAPQLLADAIFGITTNPWIFVLLVNIFLLLIGMILEPVSAILILVPVLVPVAVEFGMDPLHFGIMMIFNLVIGLLTPPVGVILYVLSSAAQMPLTTVMRGVAPFLIPLIAVLLLIAYIPALSTAIPRGLGL